MADDEADVEVDLKQRQMRLMGVGSALAGVLFLAAATINDAPYGPMVGVLGFLGIAMMVFEYTENMQRGISLGFLVSGVLVWLYPVVVPASQRSAIFLGALLALAGVFNFVFAQFSDRLQAFGARLGGGDEDAEEA
ncbi:hypothetical protein [Haloglomus litoreum]|uniref:hypothetical protein n=1 Tax=Haloglomus litoreum TaxID=3034026 RepID=UPI0023E8D615|nr:hypothetical protein [Haloglomus sp. DT116]